MSNTSSVKKAYPDLPLSLEEGDKLLKDAVGQFKASIIQARKVAQGEPETASANIAIKAAAGLGKTSNVISDLCIGQVKYQKAVHVEYYVPTHNLSSQLAEDLKAEYQIHADRIDENERPSIPVAVLKGRTQTDEKGNPLCNKTEQVSELIALGYPVSSRLCRNQEHKCEYYSSCGYQQQFKKQEVDTKGITLPAVTVMTHHQLFLERHSFLPKPDFVVIDESFYQAGIETIEIQEVLELVTSDGSPSNVIEALRAYVLDGQPLLKSFRDMNVTKKDILKEAELWSFHDLTEIQPDQSTKEQEQLLNNAPKKYLKFDYILNALAEELEGQQRDDSYLLHVDTSKAYKLVFMKRKEMNQPEGVPVLFIDADLNEEVIKAFRPETKVINIPVERQATIHQFSKTLSAYSRQKDSVVTDQIHTFLDLFKEDKKTLIVTTKKLRKEITKENEDETKQTGKYGLASINHYSNLRGLNEFCSFSTVVVLDRNQPNPKALEQTAKALWFDTGTVKSLDDSSYPHHQRGLRMKDGTSQSVSCSYHPDRYVQILLEISREAEITQAIDRLRLLRGSNDRQVFIATSIPVDVTVDYYWDWNLFHRLLGLLEQSDVLPLHSEDFLRVFPDNSVKTRRGAQDLIKNLNNTLPLIKILIRNYVLFEYKIAKPRKSAKALVSSSVVDPKETLEKSIGVVIEYVKPID